MAGGVIGLWKTVADLIRSKGTDEAPRVAVEASRCVVNLGSAVSHPFRPRPRSRLFDFDSLRSGWQDGARRVFHIDA